MVFVEDTENDRRPPLSTGEDNEVLGGWEGYEVESARREEGDRILVRLKMALKREMRCSGCGEFGTQLHDVQEREVRDLPILGAATRLIVPRRRVLCLRCGPKLEELPWLGRYERVTRRLAESVARLCAILPLKHVAGFYGLDWKTVKAIDKRHLSERLGPVDLAGVEVIAMDEFAIHKGHRYATVIVEPGRKKVLWVGPGRSRKDVRPFFDLLGPEGCRTLKAVVMDMNGAYEEEVRHHCPQAAIVYDLFHVVAKYGREVIDRVRVDEANRLRHDLPARQVMKRSRWLLLRNRENITRPEDRVRLEDLLRANRALLKVYLLKEDLKELWAFRDTQAAIRAWKDWYRKAVRSRVPPLRLFAQRMKRYLGGILAHCTWPLHTSLLEGINNKIKVIKRMAYGFRDDDYFFLKIRAAFPGNWR